MTNRQPAALAETWPCSNVRANPHLLDLPTSTIAFSGVVALSKVGDEPKNGAALAGFTERDRQPAWFNPRAAYEADKSPTYLVAGASGSGKSLMMLHLADQFARADVPVVIVDPKLGSNHQDAVDNSGGQTISLDELLSADGVFDPLRFGMSPDTAVDLAASMLQQVNPWGDNRANFETPSNVALAYGVEHGATCTGQALQIALRDGVAPKEMVDSVISLAESNAQFRAMCGINPTSRALRLAHGITYIRVGNANLSLPEPGATNIGLTQRISINLVRLMVSGSAMALTGRHGVVMLDEAWVFLGAGNSELERLARVARSQSVSAMLFTQRVSDATVAGIDEHIAGGFILPLKRAEAIAACEILQLEPTPERIRRITAEATIGGVGDGELEPNWDSMRALYEPGTRQVIRGSVALYADIHGRVVPVEVKIGANFLSRASTNYEDVAARARQ
nr:ATP-binding protein [Pseudactinotalea sp. HY160]